MVKERENDFREFIQEQKGNKAKLTLENMPEDLLKIIHDSIEKLETRHTKIKPIDKGALFNGEIRFENLSKVELGALLFALDLPKGCAHKLGMGKPLGLGSVRITPKLYLSDRKNRYKNISAEWNGLKDESSSIEEFKKAFEKYVIEKLNERVPSLWEIERMKALKRFLDFDSKPDNSKTEYMQLREFRERRVLSHPTEI